MEEGERIKRIQSYIDIKLKDTEKAIRKYKEREDYLESDYNYLKGYRDAMEDAQIYATCPAPADGRYVAEMEKKIHILPTKGNREGWKNLVIAKEYKDKDGNVEIDVSSTDSEMVDDLLIFAAIHGNMIERHPEYNKDNVAKAINDLVAENNRKYPNGEGEWE